jgi:hypothetical protein
VNEPILQAALNMGMTVTLIDQTGAHRIMSTDTVQHFTPELQRYAIRLQAAGFTIYHHKAERTNVHGSVIPARYFVYSREVDGVELFGTVQDGDFPLLSVELEHSMPIKPSREHGSSMFIEERGCDDPLPAPDTVEYAERVTQPTNWNHLVGMHRNYRDDADLARRFVVAGTLQEPAPAE